MEHDHGTWPWNMTMEHDRGKWKQSMTSDHGLRTWPPNMSLKRDLITCMTLQPDLETWTGSLLGVLDLLGLSTMPQMWAPIAGLNFRSKSFKRKFSVDLIAGCKIASSKELDVLTSVPVLSAIISSSLNTLIWKSSEPTSNCENQRSNDCKIIKCNLNPAQKLFPIKIKRRLVNLGDLDRVLTFFRATIQTIWHFDIANKIPPSIHGCLNHSLPKSTHCLLSPMDATNETQKYNYYLCCCFYMSTNKSERTITLLHSLLCY